MKRDAAIGAHKNSLGIEVFRSLYLIQNTTFEIGERMPELLVQCGRDNTIEFANGGALTCILVHHL